MFRKISNRPALTFETVNLIVKRAQEHDDLEKLLSLKDIYGWTCLRWACRVDNLKVVKHLMLLGADWTNDLDNEGRTLIHLVSTFGHAQILQHLLDLDKKSPEAARVAKKKDNFGMTCLHGACFFGQVDTTRVLVEKEPGLIYETFHGINCLTITSWSIFEDKEALIDVFREKLPFQILEGWQRDLMEFCIGKVYRLNFKKFTDAEQDRKCILTNYLPIIPALIGMALFDLP